MEVPQNGWLITENTINIDEMGGLCSMVLVYLPTSLGDFVGAHVGKYTSTIEHMA